MDKQAVEVTNCFCVPHKEYEDHVEAELQYAQDMFELNKKVKPLTRISSNAEPLFSLEEFIVCDYVVDVSVSTSC